MGLLDVVRCLCNELGADYNKAQNDDAIPLFAAAYDGHLEVAWCLAKEFGVLRQPGLCVAGAQDVQPLQTDAILRSRMPTRPLASAQARL